MTEHSEVPSVLVIGESLIDEVVGGNHPGRYPGGSPLNVAFGLGRLGVPTTFLTSIGHDDDGRAILAHLTGAGVRLCPESVGSGQTSRAVATVSALGVASYRFDIQWQLPSDVRMEKPAIVHFGSIASFLEPGASAVEKVLTSLDPSVVVTYDPNIRPELVGDHAAAVARFDRLCGLATVVKLSDEDASWLFPDASVDGVIEHIQELGAELVIVTEGSQGAVLASGPALVHVPAFETVVEDTIGAGDSYMSAVIAALLTVEAAGLHDFDEQHMMRIGESAALASAITVSRAGARPPTMDELIVAGANSTSS